MNMIYDLNKNSNILIPILIYMATQTERSVLSETGEISWGELLDWLSMAILGTAAVVSTAEGTCTLNHVKNDPESLPLIPSLIYPGRVSSKDRAGYINSIDQLVRHGLLVKTQARTTGGLEREIFVFLGGFSPVWAYNVNKVNVSQYGSSFTFSSDSNLLGRLLSGSYGVTAIPVRQRYADEEFFREFVPPVSPCTSGVVQDITEFGAYFDVGAIPSFVPRVYAYIGGTSRGREGLFFNKEVLSGTISNQINAASDGTPTWLPALSATENPLSFLGIPGYISYPNTLASLKVPGLDSSLFTYIREVFGLGVGEYPVIQGAPFFASLPCTGQCQQLGLAGFVGESGVIPDLEESYQGSTFVLKSSYLVPPPRSYSFDHIVEFANSRGVGQAFIQAVDLLVDAVRLEEALVREGWSEEIASYAVDQLEWTASLFERGIENLARQISGELRAPDHPETQHVDPVEQQIHRAYMCVRFGVCA